MALEWKKLAVIGSAFGVAAAVVLIGIGGLVYWLSNRPKELDTSSIKVISSKAVQTFTSNDEKKEMTPSGFELSFVLANETRHDYTLPESVKLFKRDKETGALSELNGKLDHAFFVPAKDKTEVSISLESSCATLDMASGLTTQRDSETCYKDALGSSSGFLALDYSNHLRVELPTPALTATPPNPPVQVKDVPPDQGDIFDRVAGCERAEHVAKSCKAQGIGVGKDNVAYYNGWQTPLPKLALPPSGYELDFSKEACGTAYQWQNYCSAQKK